MRRRTTEYAARREVAGVHQKLQELEGGEGGEVDSVVAEFGSSEATILFVVVAETGSWFWFGLEAQSFQVPQKDGILESALRSSDGGYEVHFGTLHFFSSSAIHHHLLSSSIQLLAVLPVLQFQSLQYASDTKKCFGIGGFGSEDLFIMACFLCLVQMLVCGEIMAPCKQYPLLWSRTNLAALSFPLPTTTILCCLLLEVGASVCVWVCRCALFGWFGLPTGSGSLSICACVCHRCLSASLFSTQQQGLFEMSNY